MKAPLIIFLALVGYICYPQVGINTTSPDASAALDISSTDTGILIPRVELSATNMASPVTSPAIGLMVYNTVNAGTSPDNVIANRFYTWNGSRWDQIAIVESGEFIPHVVSAPTVTGVNQTFFDGDPITAINFNNLNVDDGAFNLTTDTYTVPEDGTYRFSFTIGYTLTGNSGSNNFTIFIDDQFINERTDITYATATSNTRTIVGTIVIQKSASDTVQMEVRPCLGCGGSYTIVETVLIIEQVSD